MVSCDTRIASSSGYRLFSQPEICSGDQSSLSFLATTSRRRSFMASRHLLGRRALCHAFSRPPSLSPVILTPAVTIYFPTHGGGRAAQPRSDCTKGFSGSEPAGDLLPLCRGARTSSPAPLGRRDPTGGFEHPVNGAGRLL